MVKHLGQAHDLTLACLIRSPEEERRTPDLRAYCSSVLLARAGELASWSRALARLPAREPASMGYFYSPRLAAAVRAALSRTRYDLICVHCSSVASYVASVPHVAKMLDFGDMDSQKWLAYAAHRRFPLSIGYAIEGRKLERMEAALAPRFDLCSCTTPDEADTLRSYGTATPIGWFPNGVDTEYFTPADEPYDADTICFLGRMDYYPNEECMVRFCREILPRLQQRRPGVRLLIVGADPSRPVRRLAGRPGVVVTGTVADVRPYARRAALSVAPLRIARGTQNKILESLAMGVPVVCSPIAARGVDAVPGVHLLTACETNEYVEVIERLLDHPAERRRLADAGRARMLLHHSWDRAMRRLDGLLEQCLAARVMREGRQERSSTQSRVEG
jgi:hypothetical protein